MMEGECSTHGQKCEMHNFSQDITWDIRTHVEDDMLVNFQEMGLKMWTGSFE
jgi:hypothetical protein